MIMKIEMAAAKIASANYKSMLDRVEVSEIHGCSSYTMLHALIDESKESGWVTCEMGLALWVEKWACNRGIHRQVNKEGE